MDLKSLAKRSVSGLVYAGIFVGAILAGELWISIIAVAFGVAASLEFSKITSEKSGNSRSTDILDTVIAGYIIVCFGYTMLAADSAYPFWNLDLWFYLVAGLLLFSRFIMQLYVSGSHPLVSISISVLKYIYLALPLGVMCMLGAYSNIYLLIILLLIWINDTGAYLVGCTLGRHKMFERISPKKTWEGFFGGMMFTIVFSVLFSIFVTCPLSGNIAFSVGLGVVVTLFGTWGDLFESMIKRSLLIKDSGNIIPGLGGILDRVDSLLFVLPAAAIYSLLFL